MKLQELIDKLLKVEDKNRIVEIKGLFDNRRYNLGLEIEIKDGLFDSLVLEARFRNSESYKEK